MTPHRVAAVYDVHGNLPALAAVLAEIERECVDGIVVGGDLVPGPQPAEVLAALEGRDEELRFLRGNGENDLLATTTGAPPERVPAPVREALRWTAERLPPETLAWIASWPSTLRLEHARLGPVLFCHATPRSDDELVTRRTPAAALRPILAGVGADLVVCGHTHMQFDRRIGGVRLVNAGSVGMPFGAPGAYWLLLGERIELRRTEYDTAAAFARLAASGCPPSAAIDPRRPRPEAQMLELFEAARRRATGRP